MLLKAKSKISVCYAIPEQLAADQVAAEAMNIISHIMALVCRTALVLGNDLLHKVMDYCPIYKDADELVIHRAPPRANKSTGGPAASLAVSCSGALYPAVPR